MIVQNIKSLITHDGYGKTQKNMQEYWPVGRKDSHGTVGIKEKPIKA
jgi:hypothetical protein